MLDDGRDILTRIDPRAPLVIDTHELGRRPGTQRTLSRTAPAPADLGIDLLGVPDGSDIELELRLEAVMEGVLVSGTAQVSLTGECARCLDPIGEPLTIDVQELYVYPGSDAEEDEASRLEDNLLDLEPVLRDAVVLALPFNPVCSPDCPGLCSECGARLADDPGHTHGEEIDPRWASLAGLTDELDGRPDGQSGSRQE